MGCERIVIKILSGFPPCNHVLLLLVRHRNAGFSLRTQPRRCVSTGRIDTAWLAGVPTILDVDHLLVFVHLV